MQDQTFDAVKQRLKEIADAVEDEELSLDQALDLYEEAVSLGLRASDLLEIGPDIDEPLEQEDFPANADPASEEGSSAGVDSITAEEAPADVGPSPAKDDYR